MMNLEDYQIKIGFDQSGRAYWNCLKKGEPHLCNEEELKMVARTMAILSQRAVIQYMA